MSPVPGSKKKLLVWRRTSAKAWSIAVNAAHLGAALAMPPSAALPPTRGVFTTCTATPLSGWPIAGTPNHKGAPQRRHSTIRRQLSVPGYSWRVVVLFFAHGPRCQPPKERRCGQKLLVELSPGARVALGHRAPTQGPDCYWINSLRYSHPRNGRSACPGSNIETIRSRRAFGVRGYDLPYGDTHFLRKGACPRLLYLSHEALKPKEPEFPDAVLSGRRGKLGEVDALYRSFILVNAW